MDISLKSNEGLKREFNLVLTAADIGKRVDARIANLATEVKMPGFRPGKVPASVVRTRFGKQVLGEVLQGSIDEATRKVIEDNDLRVATSPSLNVDDYDEGKDLKATISFEVMPDIPPVDLASLSLVRPVVEIAEDQVDEAVERMARDNLPTKPVAEPRAAKRGDTAVIDFTGRIDGEAFEGGSGEGHSLVIGSNSFIPGFEDGLVGAMPGTTVEVKVRFPADYPAAHLAGKDSVFEVAVTELREPGGMKVDDEFAKSLGLEDLAALRKAVRDQLDQQHAGAVRGRIKTSVLDALDGAASEFEIPPTLVAQEYGNVCRAMNPKAQPHDHDHDHGHDHRHPAPDEGMSGADKAEADSIARRRVRLGMVLTEIGRTNNLQLTEEDRHRAVAAEAGRNPGREKEVHDFFRQNPGAVEQLVGPVFEDKVVDFILEMAKVEDRTVTAEELYREDDGADGRRRARKASARRTPAGKAAAKKPKATKTASGKAPRKTAK